MSSDQKPACFVIAPIGEKDSDVRKHSDQVLKHIVRKALSDKYEICRADEITEPGMITSQVLQAVQDSDLVVADLTLHNPNVFYELAVRHAIDKPIIHLIERRLSKIPFDVGGFRTIEFDLTDPDSLEIAVEQLRKQAEQAQSGKWGETPIKIAQVMRPKKEDSPELLLLKQAIEGISNVAARMTRLEDTIPYAWSPSSRVVGLSSLRNIAISNPPWNSGGLSESPYVTLEPAKGLTVTSTIETLTPRVTEKTTSSKAGEGNEGEAPPKAK